ncbi:MAG: HlyC/CorC family transporter [Rhodospirillales bacterium]|nr:HlyC/CorC family transporter [Rhodospirillales bacterium]MCB9995784.1 HlyC/CorC family transporter [Rhodospirillales bacterium]
MLKMTEKSEEPAEPPSPLRADSHKDNGSGRTQNGSDSGSIFQKIKHMLKGKNDTTLREAIEEYIVEAENGDHGLASVSAHEKLLLSNILKLEDDRVTDVMIPRADIFAIDMNTSQEELLSQLSEKQHSRIPVYRDTMDNVIGFIHIKDILGALANGATVEIQNIVRDVPIVSPSMHVLDLLLMMKQMRKHMAMVVDEFGGIDGLVTINDIIESIVGDIEDEYDQHEDPQLVENKDGSITADARYDIDEFEEVYGEILTEEERDDAETLGGLVFSIAGRVPARGEIITHDSGMIFEIIDADPRRVNRVLIKNIPLPSDQ